MFDIANKNINNENSTSNLWYDISANLLKNKNSSIKYNSKDISLNIGYNFNVIDNLNNAVVISANKSQIKLENYNDTKVDVDNITLSLHNNYNFNNRTKLNTMLSYSYSIITEGSATLYGYYTTSENKNNFDSFNVITSLSYDAIITENIKLTNSLDMDYSINDIYNNLTLAPTLKLSTNYNLINPYLSVKYNANTNKNDDLYKNNFEYAVGLEAFASNNFGLSLKYKLNSNDLNTINFDVNFTF